MEEQTIIAKGRPTLKNAWQFLLYTVGIALLVFIISIYVLVTLYFFTTMYGNQRTILLLSLQKAVVPTILLFLLYFFLLAFREYRFIKKRGIQNGENIVIINKEGISQRNGQSQEKLEWAGILQIKEYQDLFLFRHSSQKWSFLPKHYFQTEEDLAIFKKMLQTYHANPSEKQKLQTAFSVTNEEFATVAIQESNIIAKGNFTFKEYDQYTSLYRRKILLIYVVSVIVALGFLLRKTLFGSAASLDGSLIISAFFLVVITLATTLLYFMLKRRNRKEYKSDPMSKKEKLYIINEEGIAYTLGESFAQYDWKDFRKVRIYKNMFIFFIIPQRALILPFRLFESPEDIEKAKKLIQKQTHPSNIKFKN
ncbi:YcxB family protein [Carnobacterium mobile]|uniref:YcxB family protein n=1 Tax=Carnobacterium mobile TaxID=2750 RepID=UPI001867F6B9|nr:YcxB family protein [Carnobacterium mobile]